MTKFSSRERTLILATSIIMLTTVSYGFIIEPLVNIYSRLNQEILAKTKRLEISQRLVSKKDLIISEYEKYRKDLKPLGSDEEEIASMLKAIEATARSGDIYIMNIRPQPVKDEPLYKTFLLELTAQGEIERLIKFIYELQTQGGLLKVTKLALSPSSTKKNELKATMVIAKPAIKSVQNYK